MRASHIQLWGVCQRCARIPDAIVIRPLIWHARSQERRAVRGKGPEGLGKMRGSAGVKGPVHRLMAFRVLPGKCGGGDVDTGRREGGDRESTPGRKGRLVCVASVALKGACRAVCQHQGYVLASCGDRLCIFDLERAQHEQDDVPRCHEVLARHHLRTQLQFGVVHLGQCVEADAEDEAWSRRSNEPMDLGERRLQGGEQAAVGGVQWDGEWDDDMSIAVRRMRFRKVGDKQMRVLTTSFPMTCLSADLWSLALGDTGNRVSLWRLSTGVYSGKSVTGLLSPAPETGSAVFALRRPGELGLVTKLWLRLRVWASRMYVTEASGRVDETCVCMRLCVCVCVCLGDGERGRKGSAPLRFVCARVHTPCVHIHTQCSCTHQITPDTHPIIHGCSRHAGGLCSPGRRQTCRTGQRWRSHAGKQD
jgi:hypothetical protein